ncbi:HPr kinase/phosphorylase [Kordiimonas aestuarii]|uniref:HPr kinase/phosphorylase n=1 Tax=Kordiimonas aestuarii TaxID=1005925 RepID=UPI0021D0DEBF|nr:HPr kinase/phosphatase C-terminal domain-containing protein [Kordiimonas aestuarii]
MANPIHGTVVDVAGLGVLLRGASGAGKSDLGLRLIDRGAVLIADDQICLRAGSRGLVASAPDDIYGFIEVRGLGLMSIPAAKSSLVRLVVDLVAAADVPRFPSASTVEYEGVSLPLIRLHAFELSAPAKVEFALRYPDQVGDDRPLSTRRKRT